VAHTAASAMTANGDGKGGWVRKINCDGRDSGMNVVQVTKAKNEKARKK